LALANVLTDETTKGRVDTQLIQTGMIGGVYGGVKVDGKVTVAQALDLTSMDWRVGTQPVFMDGKQIEGYKATYRMDTGAPLGIVGDRYQVVDNVDLFKAVDGIIGDHAAIESCGCLKGGKYVWINLDLGDTEIVPGDVVNKHLLLCGSHDGSTKMSVSLLPHRIECQNMLNVSNPQGFMGIKHTSGAGGRLSELPELIGFASQGFDEVFGNFRQFAQMPVNDTEVTQLVMGSLGVSERDYEAWKADTLDRRPHWVNVSEKIITEIDKVATDEQNLWGVFNGINGYWDHVSQARKQEGNPEAKDYYRLFGTGATKKIRAYEVCRDFISKN
jgi:phage/plasmid-like protein (TIGR03299 family)